MRKYWVTVLIVAASVIGAVNPLVAETITYTYDAKGRLVKVVRTGTVNNNVQTTYQHDKVDNRTNVKTTGLPN